MVDTLAGGPVAVVDQAGQYVARSLIAGRQVADAQLIAAAPDLRFALAAMVAMHETGVVSLGTVRLAREALARAEGRS